MVWKTIVFWVAVLMVVDAGLGLLFLDTWQKRMPALNIKMVATIEIIISAILLAVYFLV